WRAFAAQNRAGHRNISQFLSVRCATQHQSAAAHVAASDEISRKAQSFIKVFQENVDVFSSGDAAKQNNVTIARQIFGETPHGLLERFAITRITLINIDRREFAQ